jgi:hypothetical protein
MMHTRVVIVVDVHHGAATQQSRVSEVVEAFVAHGTFREALEAALDGANVALHNFDCDVL